MTRLVTVVTNKDKSFFFFLPSSCNESEFLQETGVFFVFAVVFTNTVMDIVATSLVMPTVIAVSRSTWKTKNKSMESLPIFFV